MSEAKNVESDHAQGAATPHERPSKTRRKQDSHELQALGAALVELPESRLDTLPIGESLLDAVRD
ncbi:MAG: DUF615 domain-containing protein, partial [Rhizobacter sp.]|nr:DUF615 domain-containing protein [Rhizobacter sp.]